MITMPTMSYNWEADSDEAWTIPIGGGIGKIFRFGGMPVDLRLSAYMNIEAPGDNQMVSAIFL